jgi:hypothetical protein
VWRIFLIGTSKALAGGGQGDAVIGAAPRDDLLLFGSAENVVVVPDQFDLGVVGFRTRVGEKHLRHRDRRPVDQELGQQGGRLDRLVGEVVIERQFL